MNRPTCTLISLITILLLLLVGCKAPAVEPSPPPNAQEEATTTPTYQYLPIGSIVTLGSTQQKIMVVGYAPNQIDTESPVLWDYSGCAYPAGILAPDELYMFNKDDILEVFHVGYADSTFEELIPFIEKALKEEKPLLI